MSDVVRPVSTRARARSTRFAGAGAVVALLATFLAFVVVGAPPASAGPAPVMFGYVPLPANDFATTMATISASQGTVSGTTIDFTVAITNAGAGAVMYYDQWEDGYEADIANPVQATTLVFGDGNIANGDASTYCGATCTGDLLPAGAPLQMRNNVATPRVVANQFFDGRDKVASTRGFALTAGGFATNVGSLLAAAVSSYDTTKYGTTFVAPVGQDTPVPAGTTNANAYAGLIVQASQNNTTVNVDLDGNGTVDQTQTIQEGATMFVNNGVKQGAIVTATKPVQVHEATGDTTASYESRWYTLFPNNLLSNQYLSPAGSGTTNFRTINYLYNPNAAAITVTPTCGRTVTDGVLNSTTTLTSATAAFTAADVGSLVGATGIAAGTRIASVTNATTVVLSAAATATASGVSVTIGCAGTIAIPAKSSAAFASPLGQAVRFASAGGEKFVGVAGVGAQSGAQPGGGTDQSSAWDWGYTLVPLSLLTTQMVIGFAPSNSNNPPSAPAGNLDDGPVWVTTDSATTLHVDFDGDPSTGAITPGGGDCFGAKHDLDIPVAALASTKIFDSADGTMKGARIYACDGTKISGAWGEDSVNAPTGSPGFDAGYAIIPTTTMLVSKTAGLAADANGDGKFGPGDTITYDIAIADAGSLAFTSVKALDTIPAGTVYVPGTTVFNNGVATPLADDVVPPAATAFPLDETGVSLPNISAGSTVHLTFQVQVQDPIKAAGTILSNVACSTAAEASGCGSVETQMASADLSLTKTVTTAPSFLGQNAVFRVTVNNAGPDQATGVQVTDLLPAGAAFVSSSASQGSYVSGTGIWNVGTLASGGSATLDVTATINALSVTNFAEITKAQAADPDSQPAEDPLGPANPPNQDDEASVTVTVVPGVDLTVTKTDGGATVAPGGTVAYTINYTNASTTAASGVKLTETVPANATFNAGASSAGWACLPNNNAGSTCTLTIGALAGSGSGSRTFAVTALNPVAAGVTQLANTVTIADDGTHGTDPTPANNTGSDTTPLNAAPDMTVTKSDGGASVAPGGTVAYTINYANAGNQGATGVVLTETVPANATFNAGASSAGWACAPNNNAGSTCTLAVGAVAAGTNGSRTFAVTAVNPVPAGVAQLSNTVTVADDGTNGPDPTPANNTGTDTTPVNAAPDLTVTKSDGGASTTPGGTVSYTISYANAGNQGATGVVLTETVPANSSFNAGSSTAGWACAPNGNAGSTCTLAVGTLAAGSNGTATFAVNVANPVPAGVTQIANTVTVADDGTNGPDPTPGNNSGSDTTPITAAPDLTVTKTDGGVSTTPGGTVTYAVTYANVGNQGATGVVLTETVPANSTFNAGASTAGWVCVPNNTAGSSCLLAIPGTVASGGGGVVNFAVTVVNPVAAGVAQLSNTVTVADDGTNGPDPTPGNNTGSDTTPIVADPNVTVAKTDGGVSTTPGGTVAYTITYTNSGNKGATGVVLTETVPANSTFNAGASSAGWVCVPDANAGSSCTFAVAGSVGGGGASGSATFAVTVANPVPAGVTQLSNAVIVSYGCSTGTCTSPPGTDTTPITAAPDLTITKSDGGASTTPGGVATYTLNYANVGNQGAAGVALSETVPANSTFNPGASTAGWACVPDNNAGSNCTLAIGAVGAGASGTATFAVTVASPLPGGVTQIANTATIADDGVNGPDPTPGNNTSSDTTPIVAAPDLSVTKSDGGVSTTPGGSVTYAIAYANNGNIGATGVKLTETVPANSTFDPGASTAGWACVPNDNAGSACTLTIGAVAVGGGGFANFAVTTASPLPAGVSQLSNTVTVADDGTNGADPTPADNTSTDTTPLNAAPDLTVTKSDAGVSRTPGGTVGYTISYANVGNQGATGVVLTETVPANSTFDAGSSSAGWACVPNNNAGSTCTLAIGALNAGASGSRTFAVTVVNPLPAGVTQLANTVTVADDGTNGPDPTPPNNTGSDTTPITAAPDLTVTKSDGGASTTPGGTVAYTISYTNVGNQGATGVVLTETVPANSTFAPGASTAGWACAPDNNAGSTCTLAIGALGAGANGTATFAVTVASPLPGGVTQLANTVTVTDDATNGADPTPGNNIGSDTTPITANPNMTVTKTDGGVTTTPGGTVAYTITYTNGGNQAATGVVLNETVPANATFDPGASTAGWACVPTNNAGAVCTLAIAGSVAGNGGTGSAIFAVTVANPLAAGVTQLTNAVTVSYSCPTGTCTSPPGTDTTPITAAPDLTVTKSDGGATTTPGSTVAYTISYANVGNQAAAGVVLSETVPANSTFNAGASTAGWACAPNGNAGSTCTLAIGAVNAAANGTATFAVTVVNPLPAGVTQLANTVTVADDGTNGPDPTPGDNTGSDTTPITANPNVTVAKSDGGATTTPGGTVGYTITYTNGGNQAATGVVLNETVPANSTFNAGASTAGWACAPNGNAGSTCTLAIAGSVAGNGGGGSATFAVTVGNPLPAGVTQLTNAVTVSYSCPTGTCTSPPGTDTTPITAAPDLTVTKSDSGATTTPGGTVAYTISYANVGNQGATGVVLSETVPANSTFNPGASTAGWACVPNGDAGSICTLAIGAVNAGANGTATFAVTVADPLPGGVTQLSNTVTVADDGTNGADPTPQNNTGSDTTPITAAPDLTVTKSDGGASTTPGGTVAYTISYGNAGNKGASGVVLTETVPANSSFNGGASTAGWACVPNGNAGSTCTLAIGALSAGANGSATFAVTVANPLAAGVTQLANTVTVADDGTNGPDPTPGNNSGSDTTPITADPTVTVAKTDGGVSTTPGGSVTYTISYTNSGNQAATGVVLDETVPANSTFNPGASTAGWACVPNNNAGSTCTLAIGGAVAGAGGTGTATFAVTVDNPLAGGVTQLTNAVTASYACSTGTCTSPPGTDTTPIDLSSIGDTVFLDLDGNGIQDPGDNGVAGVTVTLLRDADNNGSYETTVGTTTTGPLGTYAFSSLPPGAYRVVETLPVGYSSSTPISLDRTLVANQNDTSADFGVLGATVGDQVFRDSLFNGQYDPVGDAPIAGVTVTLLDGGGATVASTTTDSAGNYAFRGLPSGQYEVQFGPAPSMVFTTPDVGSDTGDSDAAVATGRTGVFSVAAGQTKNDVDAGYIVPTDFSGTVYVDSNNDGVIDVGEARIPGVTVTLTGIDDLGNAVNVTTVTDGNGDYSFPGVRPGTYALTETQPGAFLDGKDTVGALGGTTGNDTFTGITITQGSPATGYNFGELAASSLSGSVYSDGNGSGARDPGEPGIAGVTVTLTGTDDLGNPVSISIATAPDGSYVFSGLRPGTYTVTETQPGAYADGADVVGTAGGTLANDVVSDIVLASGTTATGYVFAELPLGSIGDRVWSDLNADGIQDPGEPGLAGVTITLTRDADGNGSYETTVGTAVTDASGNYSFGGLVPGAYRATVDTTTAAAGSTLTTTNPVDRTLTGGAAIDDADFGFKPPDPPSGVIGDTVWSDTDGDGVQDPGEPGLGGVLVSLFQDTDNNGSFETAVGSVITSGAGTYQFTSLPAGSYQVVVTPPSGQTATTPVSVDVTLAKAQVREDVDFGFEPPAPPAPGSIGDRVWNDANGNGSQDPGETGVAGVTVTLRLDTDGDGVYETVAATQTTNASGNYDFANLPVGSYQVVLSPPAGQTPTTPIAIPVALAGGEVVDTADFGLVAVSTPPAPGSIGDRVWDDTNGNGVQDPGEPGHAGVTVTLLRDTDGDGTYDATVGTATTDASGNYTFPGLAPGLYNVVVTVPVGLTATTSATHPVALAAGQTVTDADFGLDDTPPVPGSIGDRVWSDTDRDGVQDAGEPGVNGVTVTLWQDTNGDGSFETLVLTTTTAGDGGYTFTGVAPGSYRVIVDPPVGQSPTTPASIAVVLGVGEVVTDIDVGLATPPPVPFDLELIKELQGNLVNGQVASWLLHVQNNGIVATPNPVTVTDVLPTGLTYVGFAGSGWSCAAVGQTVTCTLPQSLAVGASSDLTLRTRVDAAPGTTITNSAVVSAQGTEITLANNPDEAGGIVAAPPTTTTTTSTSTTTSTTSTVPSTSTTLPPLTTTGSLPTTGSNTTPLVLFALLLVSGGSLVLLVRRRVER